jgi:hypothetical protein
LSKRHIRFFLQWVAVAAAALLATGVVLRWDVGAFGQGSSGQPIVQPDHMVAFSANVTTVQANGDRFVGRFYRSSTGSYREEGVLSGDESLVAPALNFYALLRQTLRSGYRRAISEVVIGEPDPATWLPPAGVDVVEGGPALVGR